MKFLLVLSMSECTFIIDLCTLKNHCSWLTFYLFHILLLKQCFPKYGSRPQVARNFGGFACFSQINVRLRVTFHLTHIAQVTRTCYCFWSQRKASGHILSDMAWLSFASLHHHLISIRSCSSFWCSGFVFYTVRKVLESSRLAYCSHVLLYGN